MRASCQFGRDHAYLDDRSKQEHDKPLVPQFWRLLIQVLMLVMSSRGYAQPCQDRSLIAVVDGLVRGERREEVGGSVGEREQAVSQSCDVRSRWRHLEVEVGRYFLGCVVLGEAMKLGAVALALVHRVDIE